MNARATTSVPETRVDVEHQKAVDHLREQGFEVKTDKNIRGKFQGSKEHYVELHHPDGRIATVSTVRYHKDTGEEPMLSVRVDKVAKHRSASIAPTHKKLRVSELSAFHAATLLVAAARRAGTLIDLEFDPTEPRDTSGRWTKGGGELSSPGEAVHDILSGKRASVAEADVRPFLKKSLKQAAPVDLTKLRVEGHLIFGGNGLGIARGDMPQVPKDMRQQFLDEAADHGITYRNENVDPFSLYPTQKEISAQQVALKLQKHEKDPGRQFAPILVSKDNYILDGHHHWGVMATVRLDEPKVKIPVRRLSVGVRAALKEMHAFDERHNIRREAIKAAMEWALRNAEFDESEHPRDDAGKFTDKGGGSFNVDVAPSPELHAQAEAGIAAGERLLDKAVEQADYGRTTTGNVTWDDLPGDTKDSIREQWVQNELENGVEVDMSGVEQDMLNDLRRDNEDIIKTTEEETLRELDTAFPHENPQLPGLEGDNVRRIDPETLTVGDDKGEGAPLVDLDQVRFTDGSALTEQEQAKLTATWDDEYRRAFEKEAVGIYDSSEYQERESELESEVINDSWNNLSDSDKLALAANFDIDVDEATEAVDPGEPDQWVTGVNRTDMNTEDYAKTHAIATKMSELRMDEILAERGIKGVHSGAFIENTWSAWKVSSHSPQSNALQLAAARELGGVHRLSEEELRTVHATYKDHDLAVMQAYVRAQWETTQYVMSRADQDEVNVYRAIYVPTKDAKREYYDAEGNKFNEDHPRDRYGRFVKLPDTSLLRAGAQSTTATVDVANNWGGTGNQPAGSDRVVLRIRAPRTSVLSLPVFGENEQEEHELVLLGTKDKWKWDLWLGNAPDFKHPRLKVALAWLRALATKAVKRKSKTVVIDLQDADRKLPGHWLKGTDPGMAVVIARVQRQRRGLRDAADFDESQHPRDDAGKFTDGTGEALTPEQQFEKDKRDYLTPGEFAKLPPGIVKWKIAKRKAEAEAKAKETKPEEKPKVEVKQPLDIVVKPNAPSVTERERAITERASQLQNAKNAGGGLPWHAALEKARQEDLDKHGPMPANTLRERLQAISDRQSEIRQANPGMSWDKANELAKREDAAKHGPWLEPDQVKERAELLASDKNWSVAGAVEKQLGPIKEIPPRPAIDPAERTARQQALEATAMNVAKELGHDPNLIVVRDYKGRTFELNGQTLTEGGHYNPHTGLIELNAAKNIDRGTVIHEIQHAQFDYVKGRADMERTALHYRWRREQDFDFQGPRYFTKDGKVMTKYAKEIEEQTPHMSLLARAGLGSRELRIKPDLEGMRADDGVSDYSKMYWIQVDRKGGKPKEQGTYFHELAVNETLSESLRRQLSHNYDSDAKFGYTTPARFKKLGERITELYKQNTEHVRRHFARKAR